MNHLQLKIIERLQNTNMESILSECVDEINIVNIITDYVKNMEEYEMKLIKNREEYETKLIKNLSDNYLDFDESFIERNLEQFEKLENYGSLFICCIPNLSMDFIKKHIHFLFNLDFVFEKNKNLTIDFIIETILFHCRYRWYKVIEERRPSVFPQHLYDFIVQIGGYRAYYDMKNDDSFNLFVEFIDKYTLKNYGKKFNILRPKH